MMQLNDIIIYLIVYLREKLRYTVNILTRIYKNLVTICATTYLIVIGHPASISRFSRIIYPFWGTITTFLIPAFFTSGKSQRLTVRFTIASVTSYKKCFTNCSGFITYFLYVQAFTGTLIWRKKCGRKLG